MAEDSDSLTDRNWMINWLASEQKSAQRTMQLSVPSVLRDWASDVYSFTREQELEKKRNIEAHAQVELSVAKLLKPAAKPWVAVSLRLGESKLREGTIEMKRREICGQGQLSRF